MKVAIYESVQVDDEQLIKIADLVDGKVSKRRAKREEAKKFVWGEGQNWAIALSDQHAEEFPGTEESLI